MTHCCLEPSKKKKEKNIEDNISGVDELNSN